MSAFAAQYRAVVATAQLIVTFPDVPFDVRVVSEHVAGERTWVATIHWQDGPAVEDVRWALDGPPPGIRLLRHVGVPDLDREHREP